MKRIGSVAAAFLISAALPSGVRACAGTPGLALIHSALPAPLPEGAFIAEVEIDRSTIRDLQGKGATARVRKVIQGEPDVPRIVLKPDFATSCDAPLANGSAGLIVGVPRGRKGRKLVIDAITVHANSGFRLPDGVHIPIECREKRCPVGPVPEPSPSR